MRYKTFIFFISLLVLASTLSAASDDKIIEDLKFELVHWDYGEGINNIVSIYHLNEDDNGILWIGSTKGLYRFNGSSVINFTSRINQKQSNIISSEWTTSITNDKENRIWFGTTMGLYVLDQETEKCLAIPLEKPENSSPDNTYILSITFDERTAFIGTRDGLYEINMQTLEVVNKYMTNAESHEDKGTLSLIWTAQPNISDEDIWFSSRLGLHRKNNYNHIDTFSVGNNNEEEGHFFLKSVVLKNEIFLADYKDGLVRFNLETKTFNKYHVGDDKWSKAKSIVHLEGDLFLINAEIYGIAIFDANTEKFYWMKSNKTITIGRYNLYKDSAGYIWLASHGQLFKSNISFPAISKESTASLDIGYTFANGHRLNNLLGNPKTLNIDFTENNLQVNFSLTNKWHFKNLSYQYQLDNSDWINIAERNKINLFSLPAGKHSLSIRAKEDESVIRSTTTTIDVYRPFINSPIFFTFIALGFIGIASAIYIYNKRQYEKAAQIKSKYETRLATLESQALRSQINPHFIFNTLNSIKYYSIEKSPEETSDFISSFSTLIRRILENSKKNLIALHEEIETLRNYTDIEALRFHEQFDVEYKVDPAIETERFLIPPMIIQPFIENAIWHGLMHKSGNRKLKINIKRNGLGIVCEVIDNGVGREASNALKTNDSHKSSLGMKITKERMDIINVRNLTNNSFKIEDLVHKDGSSAGTKVSIYFLPKEDN